MTEARKPLPLPPEHAKSRWLVTPTWEVLHRVSGIKWEDDEFMTEGYGDTVCGRHGWLMMPGTLSRMGLPRCKQCCRLLGIPEGDGIPLNAGIEEPNGTDD